MNKFKLMLIPAIVATVVGSAVGATSFGNSATNPVKDTSTYRITAVVENDSTTYSDVLILFNIKDSTGYVNRDSFESSTTPSKKTLVDNVKDGDEISFSSTTLNNETGVLTKLTSSNELVFNHGGGYYNKSTNSTYLVFVVTGTGANTFNIRFVSDPVGQI